MQEESVHNSHRDFPIVIATSPPSTGQRRATFGAVILLSIGIATAIPFAGIQAAPVDAFIPVLQTVICFADLITASLLFAQYSIQSQRALLVLASGYMCSGTFAFLQTLAFPGAYAPAGLIGDEIDTAAWLFVLWHTTFPLAIIVYALSKRLEVPTGVQDRFLRSTIITTIACVLAIVALLTWIVTDWVAYLPAMYTGGVTRQTLAANLVNLFMLFMGATALVVLFLRRRSILDFWLFVTLVAWMPNFIVAAFVTVVRFSVGWYMARGYALIASCTVLIVLLTETTLLYARLVNTLALLRRERTNRLMSVDAATAAMAHEIRQPLTGISTRGNAALRWLEKKPPDLDKVRACVESMVEASHRGDKVISSIRGLIKKVDNRRTAFRIDDVVRQVLKLVEPDLHIKGVVIATQYQDNLPQIRADLTLLQQVLLNLVRNAIDAMAPFELRTKRLRVATSLNGSSAVLISVEDTGCGIPTEHLDHLFDPFFTTKSNGMGLGLSICRTIVEAHGGELRLAKTDACGSIFEIVLPLNPPREGVEEGRA